MCWQWRRDLDDVAPRMLSRVDVRSRVYAPGRAPHEKCIGTEVLLPAHALRSHPALDLFKEEVTLVL